MKVINCDKNGKEIDLTKITVPLSNAAYDVCKNVFIKRESDDWRGNKDTKEKTET